MVLGNFRRLARPVAKFFQHVRSEDLALESVFAIAALLLSAMEKRILAARVVQHTKREQRRMMSGWGLVSCVDRKLLCERIGFRFSNKYFFCGKRFLEQTHQELHPSNQFQTFKTKTTQVPPLVKAILAVYHNQRKLCTIPRCVVRSVAEIQSVVKAN
jgi:hypothetical protein